MSRARPASAATGTGATPQLGDADGAHVGELHVVDHRRHVFRESTTIGSPAVAGLAPRVDPRPERVGPHGVDGAAPEALRDIGGTLRLARAEGVSGVAQ